MCWGGCAIAWSAASCIERHCRHSGIQAYDALAPAMRVQELTGMASWGTELMVKTLERVHPLAWMAASPSHRSPLGHPIRALYAQTTCRRIAGVSPGPGACPGPTSATWLARCCDRDAHAAHALVRVQATMVWAVHWATAPTLIGISPPACLGAPPSHGSLSAHIIVARFVKTMAERLAGVSFRTQQSRAACCPNQSRTIPQALLLTHAAPGTAGWNALGQLGDGSTTDRYTPTAVQSTDTFASISCGDTHTVAFI